MAGSSTLSFSVSLRGQLIKLELPPDAVTADLYAALSRASELDHLRILYKGKQIASSQEDRVSIPSGSKLMALGTATEAIQAGENFIADQKRRESVIASRSTAAPRRTAKAAVGTIGTLETARFHQINPFPEGPSTPFLDKRREMLQKLAADKAILEIMKRQEFRVGELTELHPHRDPTLLGINRNAGQSIGLRLLTDRLDGLRAYNSVRRVLIHELTHNKFGPHDNDFKALDSQLTKDVAAIELAAKSSGNRLGGDIGQVFDPESRREAAALVAGDGCTVEAASNDTGSAYLTGQRLGGSTVASSSGQRIDASEHRNRAARAAEQRSHHKDDL